MAIRRARRNVRRTTRSNLRGNPMELLVVNPGQPKRRSMRAGERFVRDSDLADASRRNAAARRTYGARKGHATRARRKAKAGSRLANGRFKSKKKSPARKSAKRRATSTSTAAAPRRKKPMARRRRRSAVKIRRKPRAKRRVVRVKRRRKVRARVARANPKRRRRVRRLRANPSRPRRIRRRRNPAGRRRRLRRNPLSQRDLESGFLAGGKSKSRRRRRRSAKVMSGVRKRRASRRKLLGQVKAYRKRAHRAPKRSLRRSTAMVQYRRAQGLRRVALRRGAKGMSRSPLSKAMHLKSNPGFAGLIVAAKVLAPQVAAGAVGFGGLAMLGAKVADFWPASTPASIVPYKKAISTALLSVGAYLALDKVAPKYKGIVAIGGLLAAVLQAITAKPADPTSIQGKVKAALGLGEYTSVGSGMFGEYTSVGVGEYTSVGSGGDNSTEWANDSLRGLDDSTQWASGEGGVLSGGMFK